MSASAPPAALAGPLAGTEVCRLTVVGPAGRADLAVPVATSVSVLIPVLLRQVAEAPGERGRPWVLQRLGEDPLDPDGTPESLGLHHGDVLHLLPAETPLPALHFDDLADGVAHVISGRPGRWRPEATGRLALALGALTLVALAAALLGAGPGATAAGCAGAVALLLTAGSAVAVRAAGAAGGGPSAVAGLGALGFAALAGLTLRHGPHGDYAPDRVGVLVAAGGVAAVAAVLLALRALPAVLPGTALLTALAAAAGAGAAEAARWDGGRAAAVAAVALFVLGHFGPRLALRVARLRVPALPHNAEELQQDIDPEPLERVEQRVTVANTCLDALSLASGLVYAAGFWAMAHADGWIGWALPLAFAGAVLLRSRGLSGTLQRVPMVLAGVLGLVLLLIVRVAPDGTGGRVAVLAVLLAAAGLLLLGALRLPSARLLPVWGHSGDLLESAATVLLLPLLLQALHTYAYLRSLAG